MNGLCIYCGGVSETFCPDCRKEINQERRREDVEDYLRECAEINESMKEGDE